MLGFGNQFDDIICNLHGHIYVQYLIDYKYGQMGGGIPCKMKGTTKFIRNKLWNSIENYKQFLLKASKN